MRGPDSGTCEHRDGRLGNHRQVDGDAVALLHSQILERVREARHLGVQLGVGEGTGVTRLPLPDQRGLGAAWPVEVAIEAVVGGVQPSTHKPPRMGRLPLENGVPPFKPVQLLGPRLPEGEAVPFGSFVRAAVCHDRTFPGVLGGREATLFGKEHIKGCTFFTHSALREHV